VCDHCDQGDKHASLCGTHAGIRILQGWAEIDRPKDELRAEVIAGVLRASGLDAQVLSQTDHANVVGVGGLAIVRVLVPAYQYARARHALAEADFESREESG
jgi:hypothetical protein